MPELLDNEVQEQVEGRGAAGRVLFLRVRAEMCSLKIFIKMENLLTISFLKTSQDLAN